MLTEEEKNFIAFWEANRLRRKRFFKQLVIGLPVAVLLVIAIFASFFSGWDKRADEELHSRTRELPGEGTVILVLMAAALIIVVFTAVFSARHKWDMYEQRYRELLAKKDQS